VVHLIRASMRFISSNDRKAVAAALRPIYTAPTEAAVAQELDIFEGSNWGKKYPATVRVWRDAWQRFIPFLEFPPGGAKIIYTTNSIESLNYQLRKIIKTAAISPTTTRWSNCCGWRSVTSRTNEPENAPNRPAGPRTSAARQPSWSKAPRCRAGTLPSARSVWPSPAAWS
jgi:transposase-like protein